MLSGAAGGAREPGHTPQSQDGILAPGSYDGFVYLHRLSVEQIPDQSLPLLAWEQANRNLTEAEWKDYFPGKDYRRTCEQWLAGQ